MSEPFRSPILLWEKNPEHAFDNWEPSSVANMARQAMEHIRDLDADNRRLRAALDHLRRVHHGTRKPSRLHAMTSPDECTAKSCAQARAALSLVRSESYTVEGSP